MKYILILCLLILFTDVCFAQKKHTILYASHGKSSLGILDKDNGKYLGDFAVNLKNPNDIIEINDYIYISNGLPNLPGSISKYTKDGDFVGVLRKYGMRVTGMAAVDKNNIIVAVCDEGRIIKIDLNTFEEKLIVNSTKGSITGVAYFDNKIYASNYLEMRVDIYDGNTGDSLGVIPVGEAVFGVKINPKDKRLYVSTHIGNIYKINLNDGSKELIISGLSIPAYFTINNNLIYVGSVNKKYLEVYDINSKLKIKNYSMSLKGVNVMGILETSLDLEDFTNNSVQIGNFISKPSNTGKDWQVTGKMIYNIEASAKKARINVLGIDTEGGDRAKLNLLKESISLLITLKNGEVINSNAIKSEPVIKNNSVEYKFSFVKEADIFWKISFDNPNLKMKVNLSGKAKERIKRIELFIPFDPAQMGTNVISDRWGDKGYLKSPFIINALDMGQIAVSSPDFNCRFTGSRLNKRTDLFVTLVDNGESSKEIIFEPVYLEKPSESIPDDEWLMVRRGLLGILQLTPYYEKGEDGSPFLGSPGGVTGNNVISDPVTCMAERNLQWLVGMNGKTILKGVDLNKVAKYTLEYWLKNHMNEDGSIDYVRDRGNISADSNTGILCSAWDYYNTTGDKDFVLSNKDAIIKAANYFIIRDVDDDGIIETFRDGNGNNQFGDTGYDTISSGWKNALVNAQAYKSLLGSAQMMKDIGEEKLGEDYRQRALRLRKAFNNTFYDKENRRYIWWIGQDGRKHDYKNPLIQDYAVYNGIADCLEIDAGIKHNSNDIMNALWHELSLASYFDSSKNKTVRYINPEDNDYTGFYWGIPGNLESVPADFNFANYGSYEFPYYCNGCIFPQDTISTINGFMKAGQMERANLIKTQIYKRQHEGIFENGSGFYMGVINIPGICYSIIKWDGTPTDYEGIISRDCAFLQSTLWQDTKAYDKLFYITDREKTFVYDGRFEK